MAMKWTSGFVIKFFFCLFVNMLVYLTIIPRGRIGYEMIDSQRGANQNLKGNLMSNL